MRIAAYPPDVERQMKELYESLNEKDRRRYAGVEASKLGHGGMVVYRAIAGLRREDHSPRRAGVGRSARLCRRAGFVKKGGRKCCLDSTPAAGRGVSHA